MENLKKVFICIVVMMIVIPLARFNFKGNYASEIDNRYLTEFPLSFSHEDMTKAIESYINDRMGYRDESISRYTKLNDVLFHKMEHPIYDYGKDGYIFSKYSIPQHDYDFIDNYVSFLVKIQNYCNERDVPFLYVIDPWKTSVYSQYLAEGFNFERERIEYLKERLDENSINYIDNTPLLIEKSKSEQVFNKKYDANHWNDLGAFYGINNILSSMKKFYPEIELNKKEDFDISTVTHMSLLSSKFDINEEVPHFVYKEKISSHFTSLNNQYSGVKLNEQYKTFNYTVNKNANNDLKALYLQGSYLNSRTSYMWKSVRECVNVHAYQNVIDFDYYFNIFQPDIVVFESAEYATKSNYYSEDKLISKELNPKLLKYAKKVNYPISKENNNSIATIKVNNLEKKKYAYIKMGDRVFDLIRNEDEKTYYADLDKKYVLDEYDIFVVEEN